jgi:hypothetical protein
MATSSKVRFKYDDLKARAIESIDFTIDEQEHLVRSLSDHEIIRKAVAEWRTAQEDRLSELMHRIANGQVDDHELSRFKLDDIPTPDHWEERSALRHLTALRERRTRLVAKMDSLVPEPDGSIALTKTQLRDFFGL